MFGRMLVGGIVAGLTAMGVAGLHQAEALAEDRIRLGPTARETAEFQTEVGDRVFFSEASAELGTRGRLALEAQAVWLARHPHVSVTVEGHADDAGAMRLNLEVSERRAQVVRRRLMELGIDPRRIRAVAYGRERLVAECPAPACAAQNRRAVTVIGPALDTADAAGGPVPALRAEGTRRPPRRLN
jgi:peptidoglycan-associated lipoprotein